MEINMHARREHGCAWLEGAEILYMVATESHTEKMLIWVKDQDSWKPLAGLYFIDDHKR